MTFRGFPWPSELCRHRHIPHLVLFDEDGPNLSRHHGDDGGDVIFKPVREAAPPGDTVLVEMRHMLRHAFHLLEPHTHTNKGKQWKKHGNFKKA